MRLVCTVLLCSVLSLAQAQTRSDSVQFVRNMVKMYDLDYTEAEADSMLGNLNFNLTLYKGLHKSYPANDLAFPFAFNPAPPGMKVPTKKEKIFWDIPMRTE